MKFSKSLIASAVLMAVSTSAFAEQSNKELLDKQLAEAMQMRDSGDLFASIEMLEKLIETQPQYKRAQLELSVAFFRASLYEQAKAHAEKVLKDPDTPEAVKETVELYLSQLTDQETAEDEFRHTFEGSVGIGYGKDTNVNASPADNLVEINGIQFTLTEESTAQSDNYSTLNIQFSHSYKIPGSVGIGSRPVSREWNTTVAFSKKAYREIGDYTLDVLTLQTGLGLLSSTNWRAGLNARFDKIILGGEDLALFKGINGSYTVVDGRNQYNITADITDQEYLTESNEVRDGRRISFGGEVQRQINNDIVGTVGINLSKNNARQERQDYSAKSLNTALYYSLTPETLIYGQFGFARTDYRGEEPVSGTGRNDSERTTTLGASHTFKAGMLEDWSLNGKLTRYSNISDQEIYEYERTDTNVELSKRF